VQPAATQPAADVTAPAPGVTESTAVTPADTDNVEFESASEADDATEAGAPETDENEAAETADSETEQPGDDGPGGHADEPANPNADHQFEGEE